MSRYADYLETSYLPGEVRRSAYGEASPMSALAYELGKRFRFKPSSDIAGKYLQEFWELQNNPDSLVDKTVKLPSDFVVFSQMGRSFN